MKALVLAFMGGVVVGVVVVPAAIYAWFAGGNAPVAVTAPPMPFEKRLARTALHARMDAELPAVGKSPIEATEAHLLQGAHLYKQQCAICHGTSPTVTNPIAVGLFPLPPKLFDGHGVTDDDAAESFWKISNGIRLTGMPGFAGALSVEQMWELSLLLVQANQLPPAVASVLAAP